MRTDILIFTILSISLLSRLGFKDQTVSNYWEFRTVNETGQAIWGKN